MKLQLTSFFLHIESIYFISACKFQKLFKILQSGTIVTIALFLTHPVAGVAKQNATWFQKFATHNFGCVAVYVMYQYNDRYIKNILLNLQQFSLRIKKILCQN